VCGRASKSTIIGLIRPETATGIVTTFDICHVFLPFIFAVFRLCNIVLQ
jgi:hypothetical protein